MRAEYRYKSIDKAITQKAYHRALKIITKEYPHTKCIRRLVNRHAEALCGLQQYDDALLLYQDYFCYAMLDEEDVRALGIKAEILHKLGRQLSGDIAEFSYNMYTLSNKARILYAQGICTESTVIYQKILSGEADSADILELMRLYLIQLQLAEAAICFRVAQALDPVMTDAYVETEVFRSYCYAYDFSQQLGKRGDSYYLLCHDADESRLLGYAALCVLLSRLPDQHVTLAVEQTLYEKACGLITTNKSGIKIVVVAYNELQGVCWDSFVDELLGLEETKAHSPILFCDEDAFKIAYQNSLTLQKYTQMYYHHHERQPWPCMNCILIGEYAQVASRLLRTDVNKLLDAEPNVDFSIIMPVRATIENDTVKYAYHTLQTCLQQDYTGTYEILVSDNSPAGVDMIHKMVQQIGDPKIRYIKTPYELSLAKSFEFAILNARGNIITTIGTDDGIMPYALTRLAEAEHSYRDYDIFMWETIQYYWDRSDYANSMREFRVLRHHGQIELLKSEACLDIMCEFERYSAVVNMPLIFVNSAMRRQHIKKLIDVTGRFYGGLSQDNDMGVINLLTEKEIVYIKSVLSVIGQSAIGIGGSYNLIAHNGLSSFKKQHAGAALSYRFLNPKTKEQEYVTPSGGYARLFVFSLLQWNWRHFDGKDYFEKLDFLKILKQTYDLRNKNSCDDAYYVNPIIKDAVTCGVLEELTQTIEAEKLKDGSRLKQGTKKFICRFYGGRELLNAFSSVKRKRRNQKEWRRDQRRYSRHTFVAGMLKKMGMQTVVDKIHNMRYAKINTDIDDTEVEKELTEEEAEELEKEKYMAHLRQLFALSWRFSKCPDEVQNIVDVIDYYLSLP